MANSDYEKRREIFKELIYYIFDSFLIPLIRTNFYATESSAHRNRLFYFRHDVWRCLTEPALSSLKVDLFEEMKLDEAMKTMNSRKSGYSQIRLLPKEKGMRPITNLKRRTRTIQSGSKALGRSINATVSPAFQILNYEKVCVFPPNSSVALLTINIA